MAGIDYMRAIVAGEVPPPPIAVLMRLQPVEVERGLVVFEGEPGEEHYNPIGVVHGGYAATLLDSALGCAVHTTLRPASATRPPALEVKFVRPITRDIGGFAATARSTTAAAARRPPRRGSPTPPGGDCSPRRRRPA